MKTTAYKILKSQCDEDDKLYSGPCHCGYLDFKNGCCHVTKEYLHQPVEEDATYIIMDCDYTCKKCLSLNPTKDPKIQLGFGLRIPKEYRDLLPDTFEGSNDIKIKEPIFS